MYLFYISGSLYHVLSLAPICFGPQLLGLQLRQHSSEIWLCLLSFMGLGLGSNIEPKLFSISRNCLLVPPLTIRQPRQASVKDNSSRQLPQPPYSTVCNLVLEEERWKGKRTDRLPNSPVGDRQTVPRMVHWKKITNSMSGARQVGQFIQRERLGSTAVG